MNTLSWNDSNIPHHITLENKGQHTRIEMRIVKDIEPEVIHLSVDWPLEILAEAWQGAAMPVSEAYDDGNLYSQVRVLFNLENGCVIWLVNHIKMPSGEKMSADRLAWVSAMHGKDGKLIAI
ncbi:hypothetical protein [Salinisphaera sp. G21_0]|uniref:hypothetical protein n=1 Tax=Salinisphaera sp. G21_0 TaxID=2821094 RepID=UPI001ADC5168|nr:hypothetical protein [Salinisphaera sp. G21_0]MBO9483913.1 hypothetical protein [Salinisphaera sp. G21_0]